MTPQKTRHPGIYRKGNRYLVRYRHGGESKAKSCPTLAAALAFQADQRSGNVTPASATKFETYALDWLDTYNGRTRRGLGDLTRADYRRSMVNHVIPFFRGYKLADVEPPDVRRFVTKLERDLLPAKPGEPQKTRTASTIRGIVAPLKAMYATALEDGSVRVNPTTGVRIAGRDDDHADDRPRALTMAELSALLAEIPEDWRLFFEFLTHTGLRISEAIGLTWANVEFGDRPCVRVDEQECRGQRRKTKTAAGRRVLPLSQGIARRLWAQSVGKRPDAPVFTAARGGALSDRNVANRVLNPARERAGMEWVTFHSFRHTAASLLLAHGKTIRQVCDWLGHSDPSFTLKRYVHLLDGGLGDADFLDGLVTTPGVRLGAAIVTDERVSA